MTLYRDILKRSWQTTWKNKKLWAFGFLATFLQTSGIFEIINRAFNRVGGAGLDYVSFIETSYPGAPLVGLVSSLRVEKISLDPGVLVPVIIIVAIFIGLLWVVASAEGALVWSVKGAKKKLPAPEVGFAHGRAVAWKIVLIHVVSKLLLAALFIVTSLPLIAVVRDASFRNALLYIVSFVIFFPLVLMVSFMTVYTVAAMVISRESISRAVHTAWNLSVKYWLISIETSAILFAVNLVGGFLIAFLLLLLSLPVALLAMLAVTIGSSGLFGVIMGIAITIVVAAALLIGSIITTLELTTWTLLYERLRRRDAVAKIIRIFQAIPKFLFHRI